MSQTAAVLLTIFTCLVGTLSVAAEDLTVLGDKLDGVAPPDMMHAYLLGKSHAALDRRKDAYEKLKTPEEVAAYQKRMREFFVEQLGGFPERTPLNARVVDRMERDGYRIEKVIFESQPRHYVTALLYSARRQAAVSRRAGAVRPQRQRQGERTVSAGMHPAGQERHGRALLRPDRPGRALPTARRARASRSSAARRPLDGRRGQHPPGTQHGHLPRLGRHPRNRLPRRAARRSTPSGSAAPATPAAAR